MSQLRPSLLSRSPRLAELAVGPQLLNPGYILVNAIWGAALSFTLSNDIIADNIASHVLAVIAAQALFSALIAWGYQLNEKHKLWSPRKFILVFMVAGAARGALLQFLISALELTSHPNYLYRVFTGVTSVGFSAWFWSLIFGIAMEWRRQSGRLTAERKYLAQFQTEVDSEVSAATALEIEAFRTYLLTNLKVSEKADIGKVREELLSVISRVIRPVVEQMLSRRTAVELPGESQELDHVHFANIVQYISVRRSIQPPVQVLPATPSALAAAAVLYGYPGGFAVMAGFVVLWPITLYIMKYTVAPLIDRLGAIWRLIGVLVVAGLGALPTVWVLTITPNVGSSILAYTQYALYALVVALVMGIWFAYLDELERVYLIREQYLSHIQWKVAEVNSRRWHQQLYFARKVHGALQSEVAAVAIRIGQEMAAGGEASSSVAQIKESLEERVQHVFDNEATVANPMDVLAEIAETWAGICTVSVSLGHDDAIRLMADPIAVDTALEIVREAVSNAIRHGDANFVWVTLSLEQETLVRVQVQNDGKPLTLTEREGMGTKYLQDCAVCFSVTSEGGLTKLVADVPFRA